MKYLNIRNLFFQLPEGFDGGLSDALRSLADYHDRVTDTPVQEFNPEDMAKLRHLPADKENQELWMLFWKALHEDPPRHVVGSVTIAEHDLLNNKLVGLDVNTGALK